MRLSPLHPAFGVDVDGIDLRDVTPDRYSAEIRALFETHSLLLFRDQHLDDEEHLRFAQLFGPIEDRSTTAMDGKPAISHGVSNVAEDGTVHDEQSIRLLNLKANMLWHTDSTFLPVPALANILQARVVPSKGGATEFASTRAGFQSLDPALQERLRGLSFHHRYSHSRARIDAELAKLDMFTMWPDQCWRAVWRNPANGTESLYIASHAFAVSGMAPEAGAALLDELMTAMTPPDAIYAHVWQPGDVVIWDERALLHRGTPWPYDEPRSLASCCVSAGPGDGLDTMRPAA